VEHPKRMCMTEQHARVRTTKAADSMTLLTCRQTRCICLLRVLRRYCWRISEKRCRSPLSRVSTIRWLGSYG
jgi:hypothetical protein